MAVPLSKLGQRGTLVIPAELRAKLGLQVGNQILLEEREGVIILKPLKTKPIRDFIGIAHGATFPSREERQRAMEDALALGEKQIP